MEILEVVSDSNDDVFENIKNIFIKNNILKVKENNDEKNEEIKKKEKEEIEEEEDEIEEIEKE